jgi:hypothetical protein
MELRSAATTDLIPAEPSRPSETVAWRVWWQQTDYFIALAATALIVFLHVWFTPNVGGLWRDEVNTVNLATLPTWTDLWRFHNQDSFPLLFASIVRLWSGLFGSGDESLRLLGLLIGLSGVIAFWVNAWLMGLRFPFWSLVLVGANPMIIRYGDSMRGYGLSIAFLLLMFGLVWKVVQSVERRWIVVATVTAVLGVHATYYNAVLLFAICLGGCFVALRESNWRAALAALSVGAAAAISLLPYAPTFLRANDWNFLVQYPFTLSWMWKRLSEVTGAPRPWGVAVWSGLVIAALAAAARAIARRHSEAGRRDSAVAAFSGVALLVGIVSYYAFLKLLNYYTQPWYYLSLITFVAVCVDPLLRPKDTGWHRPVRGVVAILLLAFTISPVARIIAAPHTNLDVVARQLEAVAAPADLILLTRWECGVTLRRYYKGRTPWMTIPPLSDFRFQAYQPVMAQMRAEAPLQPVFAQAEQTLKAGGRVWLVGPAPVSPPGEVPPSLPRVTDGRDGWRGSPAFYRVWVMQVTHFLREHVTGISILNSANPQPASPYETLTVCSEQGWK